MYKFAFLLNTYGVLLETHWAPMHRARGPIKAFAEVQPPGRGRNFRCGAGRPDPDRRGGRRVRASVAPLRGERPDTSAELASMKCEIRLSFRLSPLVTIGTRETGILKLIHVPTVERFGWQALELVPRHS